MAKDLGTHSTKMIHTARKDNTEQAHVSCSFRLLCRCLIFHHLDILWNIIHYKFHQLKV